VFNVAGNFCATQAKYPHKQGPLNEGKLNGSTVTCPWHGSQFNVCTGVVLQGRRSPRSKCTASLWKVKLGGLKRFSPSYCAKPTSAVPIGSAGAAFAELRTLFTTRRWEQR
jgi:hypothetical protein